ncbi:FAD binding domain containing protein [Colletotrichum sp. SAR 10_86]|nr:FAD binding domain containing protein [Colletotrichum sp. SAR 10_65]KAI8233931.1 FAD binding domain containing protein [Colletotrichum sp. SAR 10_86]
MYGLIDLFLTFSVLVGPALGSSKSTRTIEPWPEEISHLAFNESWPQFVEKTTRWSTFEAPTFDEVFLPETIEQLSQGLGYLSRTEKTWLAKSGGHGYSPTLGAIQEAVMINMENFDTVIMNQDNTVTVGSGTKFRDLLSAVGTAGRELTVGACPCVGVMGATLGGGLGRLQGLYGLTSDALQSAHVVLWNGTVVEASENSNSDLFWGLRGAGHNFGIVVDATFATWPAANDGLQYNVDMIIARDHLEDMLKVTNNLLNEVLDPALAIMIAYGSDPQSLDPVIFVNIVYAGPKDAAQAIVDLYSNFSVSTNEQMVPWTNLTSVALAGIIEEGCATGSRANQYSILTKTLHQETFVDIYNSYTTFVKENPAANNSVVFIETFGQQGVEALDDNYSAFPHRKSFANAVVFSMRYFDDRVAEAANAWGLRWRNEVAEPEISGYEEMHIYQNYAHGDEPKSAVYGYAEWRHERLSALKTSYDPHSHFSGYHNVPSKLADWN